MQTKLYRLFGQVHSADTVSESCCECRLQAVRGMAAAPAPSFQYVDMFAQPNKQKVEYRLLTDKHVKVHNLGDKQFLEVSSPPLHPHP